MTNQIYLAQITINMLLCFVVIFFIVAVVWFCRNSLEPVGNHVSNTGESLT